MSIIRLRFKDINDEVIGDLEVSKEVPVDEMLPLILKQLGLEGQKNWKLVLEQNRAVDPNRSFEQVGARDGAVVRVVAVEHPLLPLHEEVFHSVVQPQSSVEHEAGEQVSALGKQDVAYISRQLSQQHHLLVVLDPAIERSGFVCHLNSQINLPGFVVVLSDFRSAKSVLRELAGELHRRHQLAYLREESDLETLYRKLDRWQIDDLTKLVCDSMRNQGYFLVIHELDTITPAGMNVFRELLQVSTVLAVVSSAGMDSVTSVADKFETIQIKPEGSLEFLWVVVTTVLLLEVFYLLQRINPLAAYLVTLIVFLVALGVRAYLWAGPGLKMVKKPAAA
ncbi:MAG: EsaB/YukD family protein [Chloroflexota bacterium]